MRILIIEDKADRNFGGAEKSMWDYIVHLKSKGAEIHLIYDRKGDWLLPENISLFNSFHQLSIHSPVISGPLQYLKNLNAFGAILKEKKIDLVFTHVVHGFLFLKIAKYFLKFKLVVYFKWMLPSTPKLSKSTSWGIKSIDHCIFPNNFIGSYWQNNGLISHTFSMVPDGISIVAQSSEVNINCEIQNLVFLGRIYEGKGLHILIEALLQFPSLSLIVAGYFSSTENHENLEYHLKIKNLIEKLQLKNRIRFLGNIGDPITLMKSINLIVIPSVWPEAQPRVLLEGMATRTPVIASDIGGIPEVAHPYQKEILFKPNVECLTDKIQEVLNRKAKVQEEISFNLKKIFQERYVLSKTHEELDKIILV